LEIETLLAHYIDISPLNKINLLSISLYNTDLLTHSHPTLLKALSTSWALTIIKGFPFSKIGPNSGLVIYPGLRLGGGPNYSYSSSKGFLGT